MRKRLLSDWICKNNSPHGPRRVRGVLVSGRESAWLGTGLGNDGHGLGKVHVLDQRACFQLGTYRLHPVLGDVGGQHTAASCCVVLAVLGEQCLDLLYVCVPGGHDGHGHELAITYPAHECVESSGPLISHDSPPWCRNEV